MHFGVLIVLSASEMQTSSCYYRCCSFFLFHFPTDKAITWLMKKLLFYATLRTATPLSHSASINCFLTFLFHFLSFQVKCVLHIRIYAYTQKTTTNCLINDRDNSSRSNSVKLLKLVQIPSFHYRNDFSS